MKITLESTTIIAEVNGVPARIWRGKTENGTEIHAYITLISADQEQDVSQLKEELDKITVFHT